MCGFEIKRQKWRALQKCLAMRVRLCVVERPGRAGIKVERLVVQLELPAQARRDVFQRDVLLQLGEVVVTGELELRLRPTSTNKT